MHSFCIRFSYDAAMHAKPTDFKGNKQALPSKPCVGCGRPMSWRKRWARSWDEVKFCSDACRKAGGAGSAARRA
jgi:hypothetical protein